MRTRFLNSIDRVSPAQWNALDPTEHPFLRHEFIAALESAHCVGAATGWSPHHLLIEDDAGQLLGAAPGYLKTHSWGEFVFDWSWARAYNEAGLDYYPKLVSMTPFTPAGAPHLLVKAGADEQAVRDRLVRGLLDTARDQKLSSVHVLFIAETDRRSLTEAGFLWRQDCQFHWHNRGYTTFDDFLATFRAEKRKKALRERRRVREGGVTYRTLSGREMTDELWEVAFAFSARTFALHGHEHYLNVAFFKQLSRSLPDAVMVKLAMLQDHPIAAAIFFKSRDTLYGRYWGAAANFDSLHFETCYFQGIEYCIEHGLQHFEPGTQGEHKVARGFEPETTWSGHWIADSRFRRAIDQYLSQERTAVDQYAQSVRDHVPFRRE
ncbi:hypothetical protein HNQ60_001151 [Povalibacter uvarum]|uniref:GNAT family N-acetyltransferase n=1 Tax=Povalibacter uvarum TaxID=732238 RepID=A0A841HJV2_9GAMM|nr:GNAT family N-acetyltransferase [Povalibacter uvarum]MBB6092305.1 hypothetical protein [Povalibacter uvarum]